MLLLDHAVFAATLFFVLVSGSARVAPAHKAHHQHRHDANPLAVGKRQVNEPVLKRPRPVIHHAPTTAEDVLTYITPSPGASPVAVTKESQIVTSYIPQFTICELPPIAEVLVSASQPAPYYNYSISIPTGTGSCATIFTPTITMVCAATLTALDRKITVTNCDEEITFSTKYGYVLTAPTPTPTISAFGNVSLHPSASITAAPSIETLTTFYLAPWQQLTAGMAPSEVDLKVCRTFDPDTTECIVEYQVWETSLVTRTATTTTSINISTTIHGPSQLIVETFVANVTESLTTFSMSTTMALEYQTEYTTTSSASRTLVSTAVPVSTGPTVYETLTVEEASVASSGFRPASSGSSPLSGQAPNYVGTGPTSTTHVRITRTVFVGTSTVTIVDASAAVSASAAASSEA